ncbi:Homeobox_domain-containing protein [Hexamita inflata]|uniref:Homeobox domain-containing protein n=1 Tax=Hexamita inflata TaxID=28002 RepID=A0AA86TVE9_9EUKA|nr:Homeobox domain-containing protein [Hexamita inflata]
MIRIPKLLAVGLNMDYYSDPGLFNRISELCKVIMGQEKMILSHYADDNAMIKTKTTFTTKEQVTLFRYFEIYKHEGKTINSQIISEICEQINRTEKEIKQWWYNRRSDVRDNTYIIPVNVQLVLNEFTLWSAQKQNQESNNKIQ